MIRYIIRRVLWGVVLLVAVIMITFIVFFLLPSANPAVLRAGRTPSQAVIKEIANDLGTDKPIYTQFWRYMEGLVLHFNLGYSYYSASVKSLIIDRLPATISLTIGGVVIWLAFGIPIGIISAIKRRTFLDRFSMGTALLFVSAPVYWLGLLVPVLLLLGHRAVPDPVPARSRQLYRVHQQSHPLVRVAADAVVRAGGDLGGDLRPLGARQPDRRDGRGLHPHRPGQGACPSARS